MRVTDFMNTNPTAVTSDTPIRDVVRLIFNQSIGAVLIVTNKKLHGIVTEEDILQRLFPSMQEFIDDYGSSTDEKYMKDKFKKLLSKSVKTIMTPDPLTVTPRTTLMRAQSKMFINSFTHLPVTNSDHKLVGIISQGDIFKALVSADLPLDSESEFYDWLANHYDLMFNKMKRYQIESDSIARAFRDNGVRSAVDIGSGTGGHAYELAQRNFDITALEKSDKMIQQFEKKIQKKPFKKHITIHRVEDYDVTLQKLTKKYDSALFMGNSLSHTHKHYKQALKDVSATLKKNNSMLIIQLANFDRITNKKRRLQFFDIFESRNERHTEYAFTMFYDFPKKNNDMRLNMAIYANNGKRWMARPINSVKVYKLTAETVQSELTKLGFTTIETYGSAWGEPLFVKPFDSSESHWLNIVAKR